jgi:hypothetical protein
MSIHITRRQSIARAVARTGLAASLFVALAGLAGCTSVEGTNALVDPGTFEREVMKPTLVGVGLIDQPSGPTLGQPRAPLAMPKDPSVLPQPAKEDTAMLPANSDKVKIDTTGLTPEDISRLRNARVVDLTTTAGRPLTDAEARKLTARMKAYRVDTSNRPLYMPPADYFTTVNGKDLVCLAKNGDLVSLSDPNCPQSIRDALQASNKG